MKTVAIIQARLTSTRFHRKILEKIGDKTMLQHVIDNTRNAKLVHEVVVAIPEGQDIPFTGAEKFEGPERDVLTRYYHCANIYNADTIVRITSDCPMLPGATIDYGIDHYNRLNLKYIHFRLIDGIELEVFGNRILREAFLNTKRMEDREHVTTYMRKKTKLSVDTKEDLERVKQLLCKT